MYEPILGDVGQSQSPRYYPARPAVKIAIAYMAGLVTAWSFPVSIPLATSFLLLSLALVLVMALRRSPQVRQSIWICSALAAGLVGLIRAEQVRARHDRIDDGVTYLVRISPLLLTGQVDRPLVLTPTGARLLLSSVTASRWGKTYNVPGSVELRMRRTSCENLPVGSWVQVPAELYALRGASLPGGFSAREFYYARSQVARAYATGEIKPVPPVESEELLGRLKRAVWKVGNDGLRLIHRTFPPREAGLLAALAFGLREYLPREVETAFQLSGLAHITVVSGLHLTLILASLLWLLRFAGLRRRTAMLIAGPLMGLFLLLVGPRVPTIRAAVMAVLLMFGVFLDRPVDRLNAVALAALAVLLPWPDELRQVSFQLSFLAVLALVAVVPAVARILHLPTRFPWSYFAQLAAASVIVSAAIGPLTIYHFHLWSPVVVVGNLAAIPLVSFLLPLTYVFLILHHFGLEAAAGFLAPVIHSFADWLVGIAQSLSAWPLGHVELTRANAGVLSASVLILLLVSAPRPEHRPGRRRPVHPILLCLLILAAGVWYDVSSALCRPLRADFLALGQGDCTFIRSSEGVTVLVDGGPKPRESSIVRSSPLLEYLLDQGVQRVDLLVLSHPQADHIGSLPEVLARFPVDLVLDSGFDADIDLWSEYRQQIIRSGTRWEVVRAGDRVVGLGDLEVEVLHPEGSRQRRPAPRETNEYSLVLTINWRNLQIMFTGDIGSPSEEAIRPSSFNPHAVILKVPHHGSRYSSSWEFIEDVNPVIAVAEVGRNPYGHPHYRTVRRYYGMGVQFFRTDRHGSVRIMSNGSDVRVVTTRRQLVYDYQSEEEQVQSSAAEEGSL